MFLEKSQQAKQCVLSDFRVFLGVFGSSAFRLGTPSQQLHRGNTGQPSYLNAIAHLNTYIYIYIHTYIYTYIYMLTPPPPIIHPYLLFVNGGSWEVGSLG